MTTSAQQKILVVEDEQDLQSLYSTVLTGDGYAVDTASDGLQAYDKMKTGAYDLVLLDIMLPEMDGIQVLEKLNAESNPQGGNKSVVLLTNLGQDTLIARALSLGIRGYLVKSDYTPDQLLKEIKGYL
jgi:CheY-like chemotaxis protein